MNSSKPLVSVVVTTKNEESNIGLCLQSIRNQDYPNIEIVVVDNFSVDRTMEIARDYTDLVFSVGPERSAQRNFGLLEVASGDFGMYVDADMILSSTLVSEAVSYLEGTSCIALHIEEIVMGDSPLCRVRRFERSFYSGTVIDGARFFRIDVLRELGGFDESLPPGPEDWDLDKRLRRLGTISLLPSRGEASNNASFIELARQFGTALPERYLGILHNESEQTLKVYLRKKLYYTPSMSRYMEKWGWDRDVRLQLGFLYRYGVVFTESGKWRKLLRHPVLSLTMFALRSLVGLGYVSLTITKRIRHTPVPRVN